MKKILFVALIAVLAVACGKDRFQTTPQVEITSFGPDSVSVGELFRFTATITDKEGDLQDSLKIVQKRFRNNAPYYLPFGTVGGDTLRYSFSKLNVPVRSKLELEMTFSYGQEYDGIQFYQFQEQQVTQVQYGIIVTDKAGNKSEYVETGRIGLRKAR